jgi:ElaB/YqjD/DUF883 family membrane-anchored ribosome-binding protein
MSTELSARHGNLEIRKQTLVKDLKDVVVDSESLLRELASTGGDEIAAALNRVEAKLGEGKSRIDEARLAIAQQAGAALDVTEAYVKENPWKVLAVAAAAGLLTAVLVSRR